MPVPGMHQQEPDSMDAVKEELRELLSRPAPRAFQGAIIWDIAHRTLLGVVLTWEFDGYLRTTFQVVAAPGGRGRRPRSSQVKESRRKRKKREYAATQERFTK